MEIAMRYEASTLRSLVEKWLSPVPIMPVQVTRFGAAGKGQRRYVYVKTGDAVCSHALFFFRSYDGSWSVLPPDDLRPPALQTRSDERQVSADAATH
jgi:hypothetical protein